MLKVPSNSRVSRESARFNDTDNDGSYIIMNELRRGVSLHGYSYADKMGDHRIVIKMVYTTLDGKKHEIASTEVTL